MNPHALGGVQEQAAVYLVKQLTTGKAGADTQRFAAETLSMAGQLFAKTPEGEELVGELKTTIIWYAAIPVALVAFGLGYYLAGRRR